MVVAKLKGARERKRALTGHKVEGRKSGLAFYVTAFRNGLKETGFVEGQHVAIEYRSTMSDRRPAVRILTSPAGPHFAAAAR